MKISRPYVNDVMISKIVEEVESSFAKQATYGSKVENSSYFLRKNRTRKYQYDVMDWHNTGPSKPYSGADYTSSAFVVDHMDIEEPLFLVV
jgi:hypothetical protein